MKLSWRHLLVIPGLYLAFAILPPLFANNFVFRDHVARKISKALRCRAEVVDFKLSSWTGRFKIDIPALDLYEAKGDGKAIMCLDYIHFEMWPHQIFSPFFGMEKGSIRTMEWVRARERVKTFLSAVPYLNVSELQFWEDESRPAYFQRIRFDAKKKNGCLNFNISCDVDCPALSESALTTRGRYEPSSKTLFLDSLSFTGHKRSAAKTILDGRIVEDVSDVPFTLDCDCIVDKDKIELNGISFMADKFLSTGSILKSKDGLTFLLNGSGNFTKELAQLCGLQRRVSHFDSLDCRLEGNPDESGKLLTKGSLTFDKGQLLGVDLEGARLYFMAQNDRITSLSLTSGFWHGSAVVNSRERQLAKGSALLETKIDLGDLSMSDMLEHFKCSGRMPGGVCSLKADLVLTNGSLAALLDGGEDTLKSLHGKGKVSANNVNLSYFAGSDWQGGKAPLLLQRLLGAGATIAKAKEELPFLQQIMQSLGKEKLRNYSASFTIKNGSIQSPATTLNGNMGEINASGSCSLLGEIDYRLKLKLNKSLSSQYSKQPLASLFLNNNGTIEIPIKMTGSISSPKATLDLSPEKKALFEDRVLQLVTDFYNDKLSSAAKRFLGESESGDIMQKIESSVKELLKKLL
ncbi:AsmA-like C-terminal domain-containing protein [bacterium]|nr:AsmA-like C-terminal domain-containing protein [bacterium]